MWLWCVFKGSNWHVFRSSVWVVENFNIGIYSDIINVIKMSNFAWWFWSLRFTCSYHFQFAKDPTGCFSHCSVEGGDHWMQICIFINHDGERCKLPTCHSLEGFRHIGIFQFFEVKLGSCVFWHSDSVQTTVEGHNQQVVVISNVCPWKTSCSGNVSSWSEAFPH